MMPKKVEALTQGFYDGVRRRAGSVFVIPDNIKVGKWMKVLKDVPAKTDTTGGDESELKDALIAEAKELGIEGVSRNWGITKLEGAIAEAKASKSTTGGDESAGS